MVTVDVTVVAEKLAVPGDEAVTVIVTEPADTACTTPAGDTVAMAGLDDV